MRLEVRERDGFRLLNLGAEGWTDEAAERYAADRCDGVGLTPTRTFADLEFLRSLPGLRSVSAGAAKIKDPSALFDIAGLEELGIGLNVRDLRGLSKLTRLRILAVPYRKGFEGVAELTGLETLQVEEWPKDVDLTVLGPKPELRRMWLDMKRTAQVSGSWFPMAPALTELSLYSGKLVDSRALGELEHLQQLSIVNTTVDDPAFVAALPGLRSLELENID
ncbi:hypothetical protein AB0F72_35800 [Actinoplanes sp. NPDC023936]|uniref:hypothetical protein n=1 Tax=Actinoplanes sp. NPDC023936 TaxID=3154910 RepID=UPI0033C0D791